MPKLIEFEGEIVIVGLDGVVVRRNDIPRGQGDMTIPTATLDEQRVCARRLFDLVRVTVEALDDEPTASSESP